MVSYQTIKRTARKGRPARRHLPGLPARGPLTRGEHAVSVNEQAAGAAGTAGTLSEDEKRLHEMGYAQELRRRMSGFSNYAVSFTIISILSGCFTLYGYGMATGGPVAIVWGWPFVGVMTLMVGLAMAEVCSSFPTAGGLYYWAA